MSEHEQNGDDQPTSVDNVAIAARLDLCLKRLGEMQRDMVIMRADVAHARIIGEKTRAGQRVLARDVRAVINDQLQIRTGIPNSWRHRVALVALASLVGALAGAIVGHIH